MQLQALLMREYSRMRTPLAQAGLAVLREAHEEAGEEYLLQYGRHMTGLDKEVRCARSDPPATPMPYLALHHDSHAATVCV